MKGQVNEMAKVTINKEMWSDIPLLHVSQDEEMNRPLPTIIYLHGITSSKEHNLPITGNWWFYRF